MKNIIVAIALFALFGLSGCIGNGGGVNSSGVPKTLIIGMVETEKIDELKKAREAIRKYLQEKLKMPVQIIYTNDYTGIIEALKSNKIHMAEMPPFAYVIATRAMQLTPIVTLGSNGKPITYKSVLIVNAHSNLKTMDDVKARASKLTLCFVDPASTSGHLIPRAYLTSIGLNPDSAFKQVIFAGSHSASVLSVKSNKIDVGCTTDLIFSLMTQAKMLSEDDIRVIWRSAPIVSDPIVARSDLNKDFVKKVQNAYVDFNKEHPEILSKFTKIFFHDTLTRSYIPVQDSMYNGLRKIANSVKDLKAN
jgi:phosphonate transport system substrate-binding protein